MKRLFKLPKFDKWMKKTGLTDQDLCRATQEISNGLIDADLGKGVVKKRISLPGQGKRGGARTIIATNKKIAGFFYLVFKKMKKIIFLKYEKAALQRLAVELLNFTEIQLDRAVLGKELIEVETND